MNNDNKKYIHLLQYVIVIINLSRVGVFMNLT